MTTLAELVYQLEANTEGLNKAFPALEKMIGSLDALTLTVVNMGKSFEAQMAASAASTQAASTVITGASRTSADALERQALAADVARRQMIDLNATLLRSGASADIIRANTTAFQEFNTTMHAGELTSIQFAQAKARLNNVLADSKREVDLVNQAEKEAARASAASASALQRQENAVERMRIRYLDLSKSLEVAGAHSGELKKLEVAFHDFETTMRSGVLTSAGYSTAQNKLATVIGEVKRAGGSANPYLAELNAKFVELSKGAQFALGPLSGVASRVGVLSSLISGVGLATATAVVSFASFALALYESIKAGAELQTQLLRIQATLDATGNAIGLTTEEVNKMAEAVAFSTGATQEGARNAAAALIGVRNVTADIVQQSLLAAQGLSLIGRGDIESQIRRLSRILQDPMNNMKALTESGIQFNVVEERQIRLLQEAGDIHGAQAVVLDRLGTVMAAAQSESGGLAGAWKQLTEAFNDLFETVGMKSGLLDYLSDSLRKFTLSVREWDSAAIGKALMFFVTSITDLLHDMAQAATDAYHGWQGLQLIWAAITGDKELVKQIADQKDEIEDSSTKVVALTDRFSYLFDTIKSGSGDIAVLQGSLNKAIDSATNKTGKGDYGGKAFEDAKLALTDFQAEFMPQTKQMDDATAKWKRFHDQVLSVSGVLHDELLQSVGLTERQFEMLSQTMDHLQTDLQKAVQKSRDDTEAAKANVAISGALGNAKQRLITHEAQLTALTENHLAVSRADAEAVLANLSAQDDYTKSVVAGATALQDYASAAAAVADTLDVSQQVDVARMQLSLVRAGTDEQNKQIAILQKKQEILQAGRDVTAEELALTGELVDLQNSIDHEKDIKALEDQVALQGKQMQMFTLTKNQREDAIALQQKEIELTNKYGSLVSEQAQREEELYKQTLATNRQIEGMNNIMDAVESGFDDAFMAMADYLSGTEDGFNKLKETASKALHDIAAEILKTLVETPIKNALFGALGAGLSGGSSPLVPITNPFDAVPGGLPTHHATGGMILPGRMGIVGENGPELVYGGADGASVTPMSSRRGGGLTVNVYPAPGTTADATQRSDGSLDVVVKLIDQKISSFNRQLPRRVAEINRDPRLIG